MMYFTLLPKSDHQQQQELAANPVGLVKVKRKQEKSVCVRFVPMCGREKEVLKTKRRGLRPKCVAVLREELMPPCSMPFVQHFYFIFEAKTNAHQLWIGSRPVFAARSKHFIP